MTIWLLVFYVTAGGNAPAEPYALGPYATMAACEHQREKRCPATTCCSASPGHSALHACA